MIKKRSPLAAALSAALLCSPGLDAFAAAVKDGNGLPGAPVTIPLAAELPKLEGPAAAVTAPLEAPSALAGQSLPPSVQAPLPALPALQAPEKAAFGPAVAKLAETVAPQIAAIQAPSSQPAEAAAAGRTIEEAMTGSRRAAVSASAVPAPPASVFSAMNRAQKREFRRLYLAHLRSRDGEPSRDGRRLALRDKFFRELEANPVRRTGPPAVDLAAFDRNEARYKVEAGLDPRTLWALAVSGANRSERYGVEYGLERVDPASYHRDDPMRYIVGEESYHTHVLKDALEIMGVHMRMLPPHPVTAFMVRMMVHMPKPIAHVLIFCGEVAGVAAFRLLRDKARELFADQPEPLARVEELFRQILVDEVGHVHHVRSMLGPVRLKLARLMMPLFARYFMSDMPALAVLFGKKRLMAEIMKADVDGAAAPYPDRFQPWPAGR